MVLTQAPQAPQRTVDVAVRERFLWIDREAYPLANIARVSFFVVHKNVWRAVRRCLKLAGIAAAVVFGALATDALLMLARLQDFGGPPVFTVLAGIVGLCLLITGVVTVFAALSQPRRFALSVETAGPAYAFIVTYDPAQIHGLVDQITHAINNPEAEFHYRIEHVQFGDTITQIGDRSSVNKR
ncbi:DUF6232 family protein [Actinokineospora sp. NPDC004072]